MTAAPVNAVELLGVTEVGAADGARERGGLDRLDDQMQVIRHEAVAEDGDAMALGFLAQEFEVGDAVVVGEEDGLIVIAALHDVMGRPADETGDAGMVWLQKGVADPMFGRRIG